MPPPAGPLGPFGPIPGMYFDPVRNRYFPKPSATVIPVHLSPGSRPVFGVGAGAGSSALPATAGMEGPCDPYRKGVRWGQEQQEQEVEPVPGRKRIRMAFRGRRDDAIRKAKEDRYSRLSEVSHTWYTGCEGETITSLKSYPTGGLYLTTDHGKVIMHRPGGHPQPIPICTQRILGMHIDLLHMTYTAVSNGPEPHVHLFRRDPHELDQYSVYQIELPPRDVFAMSGFADACTVAASRLLISISAEHLTTERRPIPSDPMCIHHAARDIVIAGLRNGSVVMHDLRTSVVNNTIANLRKAVIGVKRLSDHAVPFGVLTSALDNQLAIYDVRFTAQPLRTFESHVNSYHTSLALETSPDDSCIFAAGSDMRIRAYSSVTGEEVVASLEGSPLDEEFTERIEVMDVGQSGLRVATRGKVASYCVDAIDTWTTAPW